MVGACYKERIAHRARPSIIFRPDVDFRVDRQSCDELPAHPELQTGLGRINNETRTLDRVGQIVARYPFRTTCGSGHSARRRKLPLTGRKGQIVRIARIGKLVPLGELSKTDIKEVRNQVGDDWRTWTSLRQYVLKAGDLRDDRRELLV